MHTNEGRLLQTVGAQHENRRVAMFVNEDCVGRSDVDDLRTRTVTSTSIQVWQVAPAFLCSFAVISRRCRFIVAEIYRPQTTTSAAIFR